MNYPKYFKKAIRGVVGGRFMTKRGDVDEFLLKGDPSKVDPDEIIVEIFDEESEKYFKKQNKAAIINGYLIEIGDHTLSLDETNAVSDGYLKDLLKLPAAKRNKRVKEFTSPVPIQRLLDIATEENRPIGTINYLKSALAKFNAEQSISQVMEMDDIKVGAI